MAIQRSLVMTLIGPDRPGLVEQLSQVVSDHKGNWIESRMAHLAGHFAGILRVQCPDSEREALVTGLQKVGGLAIHAEEELPAEPPKKRPAKSFQFDVMGNDRPGIVRELAAAIVEAGGNVEELTSNLESAPHAGHPVFHATGAVTLTPPASRQSLSTALESLSPDLSVTIEELPPHNE